MVRLQHYFRACNYPESQQLKKKSRMHHSMYSTNPELLRDFIQSAGIVFTFVSDWSSEEIYPNTYRFYGMQQPAQEATSLYIDQVRNFLNKY